MKVLILAGGSGSRLWPLSRERYPKQFIKFSEGDKSLFQKTFLRGLKLTGLEDIYIITNINYKFLVMGEIEELGYSFNENNIIVEPEGKNTLPAIYSGVIYSKNNESDTYVVFPSDHLIEEDDIFVDIIKDSLKLSDMGIVTFGIKPDFPNTGFGYIEPGEESMNGYRVRKFREKPDLETAINYISQGYLWNSGIFMFNSKLFSEDVKKYTPDIYNSFINGADIKTAFQKIEKGISIDYGILEKSDRVYVVPVEINWNDLGSFDSLYKVLEKDFQKNASNSCNILLDSKNNFVFSDKDKIVTTIGIEDLIVIDNKDALLICKKDNSQKVKDVVDLLKEKKDKRTEYHLRDYRPWGMYKIIEEEQNSFKIKRIFVNPGKKLSYQMHNHRSEHWVVVKGEATVIINDIESVVKSGESIYIQKGQKHRLENKGETTLEIIEVQLGDYLEEDDIIRFDDDYGRQV